MKDASQTESRILLTPRETWIHKKRAHPKTPSIDEETAADKGEEEEEEDALRSDRKHQEGSDEGDGGVNGSKRP